MYLRALFTLAAAATLSSCGETGAITPPEALAGKSGTASNGTTLAAIKTLDICRAPGGALVGSGEISVWNAGALATSGLAIWDRIQTKGASGQYSDYVTVASFSPDPATTVIQPGTDISDPDHPATVFKYTVTFAPGATALSYRNSARVTIMNHSGSLGRASGPEPKYTFTGTIQPCSVDLGCTLTQGYWGTYGPEQNPHTWPAGFSRDAPFFNSGMTWQQVLDASPAGGNAYIILAHQYIASVLNQANGAAVPAGVQSSLTFAQTYFSGATAPDKGTIVTHATVLDDYNNGVYPGGPPHCE
ncbi:MAG TPA: hypothetical protein VEW03_01675 [Longimicrobiaceae bacterium]|nr:hypothetical protein [Longimicrobiaceae bacterium]